LFSIPFFLIVYLSYIIHFTKNNLWTLRYQTGLLS
jgi:hypothetical protein